MATTLRFRSIEFLIESAQQLQVTPIVKYSALSFFADRFHCRLGPNSNSKHWLLQPMKESNLQLFALVAIWVATKIHDCRPLSVKKLKSFGDGVITDQHFTLRDFLEAEVVLMQVLNFEIGTTNLTFIFLEDLYIQFNEVAKVAQLLSFEMCMDLMDLLYEMEDTSVHSSSRSLAASILIASYVITVPKQQQEFPVLPWVKFVTSLEEEETVELVRIILNHVFQPPS